MEFLNGLKTQPLELLAGKVCQKAGRLFTVQAVVVTVCFFPPLLTESKPLRQNAQDTGLWQYVSHSFVYVDFFPPSGVSKKEFMSGDNALPLEWNVVNVKSLYRQTGQMFYRPLRHKGYLPPYLCTLFCFSRDFVPFLPLMTFLVAEHFYLLRYKWQILAWKIAESKC